MYCRMKPILLPFCPLFYYMKPMLLPFCFIFCSMQPSTVILLLTLLCEADSAAMLFFPLLQIVLLSSLSEDAIDTFLMLIRHP